MNNIKELAIESIEREIEERAKGLRMQNSVCELLKSELKALNGKKLTKRIEKKLTQKLDEQIKEGFSVSLDKTLIGINRITIWNRSIEEINIDNGLTLFISEKEMNEDGTINYDNIIQRYKWLSNGLETINTMYEELKQLRESTIIERYNNAREELQKIQNEVNEYKSFIRGSIR